jgi:eukaryotic-like serine/threonine-protein kinase
MRSPAARALLMQDDNLVGHALGHYQVVGTLGAGGMGIVYRAHDPRLNRDVAVKVLPPTFSTDPDRVRRFEHEARAVAALNHPNILAVHDIGSADGSPYIVSELLKGENLRQRLQAGPIPRRKAIDYAVQIARGLAAAHDASIVHRDLKPENLFVTDDGRVKILDFGLAKLSPSGLLGEETATRSELTGPGQILGTVGYMSPEQVRGGQTDARSDIFALGAILYEVFSGQRAFQGASAADTLSAILNSEPPSLPTTAQPLAPAIERLVRHCLEKKPAERFQSAHDIAFTLETLSGTDAAVPAAEPASKHRRWWKLGVAAALAVLAAVGVFFAGRFTVTQPEARFHKITFRRGYIGGARFMPDGQNLVYSAAWDGSAREIFTTRFDAVESTPVKIDKGWDLLAISKTGELALLSQSQPPTLATVPFTGGRPKEVATDVRAADFGPDGESMAIIRPGQTEGDIVLEYPKGRPIYHRDMSTPGSRLDQVRVSPDGHHLALFDLVSPEGYGKVVIVDREGKKIAESKIYGFAVPPPRALCWSKSGKEVWFSATSQFPLLAIMAMDLKGNVRTVLNAPAPLALRDLSRDGRLLFSREDSAYQIMGQPPSATAQSEQTWYGWSMLQDISDDGWTILFLEAVGKGGNWANYIRRMDGTPAYRLDVAYGRLTADGQKVVGFWDPPGVPSLSAESMQRQMVRIAPIGAGDTQDLPQKLTVASILHPLRDGTPLIGGFEKGGKRRTYLVPRNGSPALAVTPEGIDGLLLTPDEKYVLTNTRADGLALYPLDGGHRVALKGRMEPGTTPLGFDKSGKKVFLGTPHFENGIRAGWTIRLLDTDTGKIEPWMNIDYPGDRAGLGAFTRICLSADGKAFAYSIRHTLSQLFVTEDLR